MNAYVRECTLLSNPVPGARGWHIHSYNDTIGATIEIMAPTFGTTFAQLAAEDNIEADSDQAGDTTQTITVFGIDNAGKKAREDIELNGTTAVDGTTVWRYIENIRADALSAGIMWVNRDDEGHTYIMEIEAGLLNSGIAQHFNGEDESYITFFAGGLYDGTKDATFELRWYPDDASCLATAGYEVLDRLYCPVESGHDNHPYPMPIGPLPPGGWIVVYAIADAASAKGWCTLQGFDMSIN